MKKIIPLIFVLFFSRTVLSDSISDKTFIGEWCGQWDNIYSVCVVIDSVESDAVAKYKWQEKKGDGFKKSQKKIRRLNLNTLELENIIFVLDERNLNQASVIGIFQYRTRMAVLDKNNTKK